MYKVQAPQGSNCPRQKHRFDLIELFFSRRFRSAEFRAPYSFGRTSFRSFAWSNLVHGVHLAKPRARLHLIEPLLRSPVSSSQAAEEFHITRISWSCTLAHVFVWVVGWCMVVYFGAGMSVSLTCVSYVYE
jgi:hypothetical protein